jgi:hypothetical protein
MNLNALEQTERLLDQILQSGVSELDILQQFYTFKHGLPHIHLDAPCTTENGAIRRISAEESDGLIRQAEIAIAAGRVMKFVPASGAATRMFKAILATLGTKEPITLKTLHDRASTETNYRFTLMLVENLHNFAFYSALDEVSARHGINLAKRIEPDFDYAPVLRLLTEQEGLNYANLPKGLIVFHRYSSPDAIVRTAFEEHIVEALHYTLGTNGTTRLHFTVSPEHHSAVEAHLTAVRARYEHTGNALAIELSEQKQSTNTVAVTPENEPFLTEDGLHFRPAGHGALLENLNDLQGDIVFVKNIDNVVPDRIKADTYRYKKILCGLLVSLQERIFAALHEVETSAPTRERLLAIAEFGSQKLAWFFAKPLQDYSDDELRSILSLLLNRPIRVCGMVKNEGEPGGGPFVVKYADGSRSLQIVESAQIDLTDPNQRSIFDASTHFNPVDLVCAVRNHKGEPFNLLDFRDNETGFISFKSSNGRELKALELPGLWNGSMAYWNTVFVEVPTSTFHPVKTINDLLRSEHQGY